MEMNEYLKNRLLELGYLQDADLAKEVYEAAKARKVPLFEVFKDFPRIDLGEVYAGIAKIFDMPYITASVYALDASLSKDVPTALIAKLRIIPFAKEKEILTLVTDSPLRREEAKVLAPYLKGEFVLALTTPIVMDNLIGSLTNEAKRMQASEEFKSERSEEKSKVPHRELNDYVNSPSVLFADTLLEEAIQAHASDIHIEPMRDQVEVRFRIDGTLLHHCTITLSLYPAILARYKILSNMDISERRLPQDGKISRVFEGNLFDFRISTLPNIYGEKIVIRIFNTAGDAITVDSLANSAKEADIFHRLLQSPHGIILLTGPTGSGKTTTLYSFLRELNRPGVNIQTVEDPVENQIPGLNQLQVNNKTGLTFSVALRSILRQDPDIIMVGEIRDEETAHIAVQAAITGHLVLSTVHTNDAITTISRLIDMGVEPYLVADSLLGAISQRLVKCLCPHCRKERALTKEESQLTGLKEGTSVYEPQGCVECNNTGYLGRKPVFEIMLMNESIRSSIDSHNFSSDKVKSAALKSPDYVSLKQAGAELVKEGVASVEEFRHLVSLTDTEF